MKHEYEKILKDKIRKFGKRHPKKHGEWYALRVYGNHYLVLDTWNGQIDHHPNGANPTDTNNMYRCVYAFLDANGNHNSRYVRNYIAPFWCGHITGNTHKQ